MEKELAISPTIDVDKMNKITKDSYKAGALGFISGVIIGPAFPIFYLAGFKDFDWNQCPFMK